MEDFIAYGFYAKRVEDLNEQVQSFMTSGKSNTFTVAGQKGSIEAWQDGASVPI